MSACTLCGGEHAPLDSSQRYAYATAPGTDAHTGELAWFAKHGIVPVGLRPIEAFVLAHRDGASALVSRHEARSSESVDDSGKGGR